LNLRDDGRELRKRDRIRSQFSNRGTDRCVRSGKDNFA